MNYAGLATTARTQLKSFGRTITLRKRAPGAYDPATSKTTDPADTDVARIGLPLDFGTSGVKAKPGSQIEAGDKQVLMEVGVKPDINDQLIFDDHVFTIIDVSEVNPAGTPVLYILHARR